MRKINPITTLEVAKIQMASAYGQGEIASAVFQKNELEHYSVSMWELTDGKDFLGYAGITAPSLTGPFTFWLLPVGLQHMRQVRLFKAFAAVLHRAYPFVTVYVEDAWDVGKKFAAFCGFHAMTETVEAHGKVYRKYRGDDEWRFSQRFQRHSHH